MSTSWDYTELAARMMGLTEKEYEALEESGDEYDKIDEMLSEKYDISLDAFMNVARALLPMTMPQRTAIGGQLKYVMGVFESVDNTHFRSIVDAECTMFKVGSIVRLKIGNDRMRITSIADKEALCQWRVDRNLEIKSFPLACLTLIEL
ncbi:hypothetical protein [Photobacterium carnosum]|uniref:hypothetical protein n=1 Tax=Photobacterium carnosum TaxID=2023717 RepID=UPI00242B3CA3|nr:hypothetical protein [Photobacterium carnosum]